jgi:hypothetical protein
LIYWTLIKPSYIDFPAKYPSKTAGLMFAKFSLISVSETLMCSSGFVQLTMLSTINR